MEKTATREVPYFIGSRRSIEGQPLAVRSRFDHQVIGTTFRPDAQAIDEAVRATTTASARCASLPTFERARILRAMSEAVSSRRDEFVRLLAQEAGKPVKAGRVEVDRCIFNLRNASEEAQRIEAEFIPLDLFPGGEGRSAIVRRFPLGTILAITPFNFPLNLVAHKLAPAIAAGNALVQKPASMTPLCSLLLAECAYASGLPDDVLSVLPCSGVEAGALTGDDRFALLTFTGSAEVGWGLKASAGKKRVTLELGGNAGAIVQPDADLPFAARRCAAGGFSYAGQSCIAVQRVFVQSSVFEDFSRLFVDAVERLRVGDPLLDETDVGPLITLEDAKRVEGWIDEARSQGATVLTGGERRESIVTPAVLTGTKPRMKVNCEEVFGPVVTLEPYDDLDQAFGRLNASRFGLQAGIFTHDLASSFRAFEALQVGGVVVNDVPTFRADHMPYGGVKDSGLGREGAKYAIEEMTERKVLVLNLSPEV